MTVTSPPPEPQQRLPTRIRTLLAWCLPPAGLALACRLAGPLLPEQHVQAQIIQATMLMASRWLLLVSALWCLRVGMRFRSWAIPGLLAALSLLLAGVPVFGAGAAAPAAVIGGTAVAHTGASGSYTGASGLRLLFANVNAYTDPPEPGELETAIAALDPDIVILAERRIVHVPGLERVADNLDVPVSRPSHYSLAFCRAGIGCDAVVTEEFGSDSSAMPLVLIRLFQDRASENGPPVCIMGLHAPPPVPINPTGLVPHVRRIAESIDDGHLAADWGPCRQGDGVLATGDLNHVPGSAAYQLLVARGLSDALRWRGVWASSWPAGGGWPNLPTYQLDQVLVGHVGVDGVRQLRLPGSDHKALIMRVSAL